MIKHNGGATHDKSEQNAVLVHQLNQKGYPTSGISTTPKRDRAEHYATGGGKYERGFVFIIDRTMLDCFEIKQHVVSDQIPFPSIPEDEEVILVAKDYGNLPDGIVCGAYEVNR